MGREELDSEEYDESDYFKCPITQQKVDPNVILPNRRIADAISAFK